MGDVRVFLQRTQMTQIDDENQMKIVDNLVNDLKRLSIPWNCREFRQRDMFWAVELLPIVLFDVSQQIQVEECVMNSLLNSDITKDRDPNILSLIVGFVCNDK